MPRPCRACRAGQPRRRAGRRRPRVLTPLRFSAGPGPKAPSPRCQYTQLRPQGPVTARAGSRRVRRSQSAGPSSPVPARDPSLTATSAPGPRAGPAGGPGLAAARSRTAGAPALPSGPGRLVPAGGRATGYPGRCPDVDADASRSHRTRWPGVTRCRGLQSYLDHD
jgi:hypothetical protein